MTFTAFQHSKWNILKLDKLFYILCFVDGIILKLDKKIYILCLVDGILINCNFWLLLITL